MIFSVLFGWFMTRLILTILFFLIITPLGFIAKVARKDFLEIKHNDSKKSYWNNRNSYMEKNQNYEKQF